MDVLYRLRRATAAEVRAEMPQPPSYSTVRALLRILEEKRCIEHDEEGSRYVYRPRIPVRTAKRLAARRLLETFFEGSVSQAVETLLDVSSSRLSDEELSDLRRRIEDAKKEGR
jgi:predicted transcriptional regulator